LGAEDTDLIFGMSKRIFPADLRGRIFLTLSLLFVGYVYLDRIVWTNFFVEGLDTYLTIFFWLSPVFCLVGFIVHIILVSLYVFRSRGHLAPGLFLIVGLLLAAYLPVPPTPEEISFSWERGEYEQIVELARNNQLQHGDNCLAKNQFLSPSSYYQWSRECIQVSQQDGFVVEIVPRSLERPLVFVENPNSESFPPCWSNRVRSEVFKQLSEHWFICERWLMDKR
jgi:hypothetical protein